MTKNPLVPPPSQKKRKYNIIDITSFIYIIWVLTIVLIFREKIKHVHLYFIFFISYSAVIVIINKLYHHYPRKRIIIFLKYFYPVLTFWMIYKSIQGYVTVFYGRFLDDLVIIFQYKLFHTQPVLYLEKIIHPVVTEVMKLSYFSYFFYIPVPAFILFFSRRYKELKYFIFIITFTYYVCYIGFVLFPVQGPRFALRGYFADAIIAFSYLMECVVFNKKIFREKTILCYFSDYSDYVCCYYL